MHFVFLKSLTTGQFFNDFVVKEYFCQDKGNNNNKQIIKMDWQLMQDNLIRLFEENQCILVES